MLIAALLTYQPAAMFFWVFLAVALIGAADDGDGPWRWFGRTLRSPALRWRSRMS